MKPVEIILSMGKKGMKANDGVGEPIQGTW
jgi:hypothetical protein